MKTVTELLREKLHDRMGIVDTPKNGIVLGDLYKTENCPEFERLALNRRVMGAIRYGKLGAPGKPKYDRVPDMIRRLEEYKRTGNLEHLVDVANLCLCEYVEGDHPKRHFKSKDDGQHTKELKP